MILPNVPIRDARRTEYMHDGFTFWPSRRVNARVRERISVHAAPDPPRDSDFVNGHGTGVLPAHQQVAFTIDRSWELWEAERFPAAGSTVAPTVPGKVRIRRPVSRFPRGRQGAWGERMNIARPRAITRGDRFIGKG